MIRLGEWNELRIVKKVDFGVYLAEKENAKEEDRILLPRGSVRLPSGKGGGNENRDPGDAFETLREGQTLRVFLYRDSEDRPVATMKEPAMTLGKTAFLKVAQVTRVGAFLDWGLEKDLFLPFHEQTKKVKEGETVLAALYIDKSGRLCATMNVYPYLQKRSPYGKGQQVKGVIYETSENFGAFVAVDGKFSGLIPKREMTEEAEIGKTADLRISRVLPDGRLELSLRKKAYKQMDDDAEAVLSMIKDEYGGRLPFDDKADPERIRDVFGISKAAFKRAVGHLYREKKIGLSDGGITAL